jgi:DNA-binding transcriptional MerR regulator
LDYKSQYFRIAEATSVQTLYSVYPLFVYRIQSAAKQAGVSTQLLRAWERRYGLVEPQRTDSRYRLYTEDDVAILRGAKAMVDDGLRIAEVARMPREELRRAAMAAPRSEATEGAGASLGFLDSAMEAVAALDAQALERTLFRATGMGTLPAREMCERVLLPLLREIGKRWEEKRLSIAAEHFGSAIVRARLLALLASEARHRSEAHKVVCACPEGEMHEGGLLAFAVHAAGLGLEVLYLGANTPIDEILATAEVTGAGTVALSLTRPVRKAQLGKLVSRLSAWKTGGGKRRVLLGGTAVERQQERFRQAGLIVSAQATGMELTWGDSQ